MDNVYNFPKDDRALAILSQAAMHAPDANSFDQTTSNSLARAGPPQPPSITNHRQSHFISPHQRGPNMLPEGVGTPSDYNFSASILRNMETLTYGTPASRPGVYMNQAYQDLGTGHYSDQLGILNAEQYDDGRSVRRSQEASEMRLRQQQEAPMPFGLTSGPQLGTSSEEALDNDPSTGNRRRKRARADMSSAIDEEEWAAKRVRGRPRVDTKDETAADRRRTQIRMAQRAYRHRKETTISSLEKQVQELRGTNEEMSNTFVGLYDFAVNKGLLQREPEFGQQLQSTIEKVLSLAKSSPSEDGTRNDEHQAEEALQQDQTEAQPETDSRTKGRRIPPRVAPLEPSRTQAETAKINPWAGYELTMEETPEEASEVPYQHQPLLHRTRHEDHQIISRATEENASFPFDFLDLQQYRVEVPPVEDYLQNFFLETTLPLPSSHCYQEPSFARKIQRGSLEKAFGLLMMQNPPQEKYQQVFGFCLLYETRDEVEARIRRCLGHSSKAPLQEWRAPFVHVGGAGTYYPKYENEEFMPKFRTGYSMGPQSPAVAHAQEIIQNPMRCKVPGFEGEFFDADDVEGYLRGRGLEIPGSADFVTAQLDLLALSELPSPQSQSRNSITTLPSPNTPTSSFATIKGILEAPVEQNLYDVEFSKAETTFNDNSAILACTLAFPLGFAEWDNSAPKEPGYDTIDPIFTKGPVQAAANASPYKDPLTVTLDVNVLLQGLMNRAVCIGRAPGFRPTDVNAAIIEAIRAGSGASQ